MFIKEENQEDTDDEEEKKEEEEEELWFIPGWREKEKKRECGDYKKEGKPFNCAWVDGMSLLPPIPIPLKRG